VFLASEPSLRDVEAFIEQSRQLPVSYGRAGILDERPPGFKVDRASGVVGHGPAAFERAKRALIEWRQFGLEWVRLFPAVPTIEPGSVVAVLVRHLGFWSLNGCRVLSVVGSPADDRRFGFIYGTLINHAEMGEELFEMSLNHETGDVVYRLVAISRPRAALARLGYPIARALQARFRRDSIQAVRRAIERTS
jgi:uncharacterized protein (UPF0548 family)